MEATHPNMKTVGVVYTAKENEAYFMGRKYSTMELAHAEIAARTQDKQLYWLRKGDGVKGTTKVLGCTGLTCGFRCTLGKEGDGWWAVKTASMRHSPTCTAAPRANMEAFAKNANVVELLTKRNTSQRDVISFLRCVYGVDVSPTYVTRLKDLVSKQLENERRTSMNKLFPFLRQLVANGPSVASVFIRPMGQEKKSTHPAF
jgi:hypothetical protein